MAVTAKLETPPRWHLTFAGPDSLANDLGSTGAWVGRRTGQNKRDHGQMEDFVLRRLLVAWKECDRLSFPCEITATTDEPGESDFLISSMNGKTLGIEVTQAGDEAYQASLTRSERQPAKRVELFSKDGFVGDGPEQETVKDILKAIEAKNKKFIKGAYRTAAACDLAVYDNSEWAGNHDLPQLLTALGCYDGLRVQFRQIHLITGDTVFLDLFGNRSRKVDVGNIYEIDYANWIFDQVEHIRGGSLDQLDLTNIAEELEDLGKADQRAIKSYLTNLLHHLLKWQYQPRKRSASWRLTITNARFEIADLLDDSPSLKRYLLNQISDQYHRARTDAAIETSLPLETFPEDCPYEAEQILDLDFIPGKNG